MPGRETPLVTGEIYHIVNRGVAAMNIFRSDRHYRHALETALYYQNQRPPLRYSYFSALSYSEKAEKLKKIKSRNDFLVEILCYCLMPNHFHFLLKQLVDNGISNYLSKFSNSFTRYFNTKHNRIGPLFQGKFKSVHVDNEQQLLYLSRYIHLNPYSSGIVKHLKDLPDYQYSSLLEYLGLNNNQHCNKEMILGYFRSKNSYKDFVFEQAYAQRELDIIKHSTLEVL